MLMKFSVSGLHALCAYNKVWKESIENIEQGQVDLQMSKKIEGRIIWHDEREKKRKINVKCKTAINEITL